MSKSSTTYILWQKINNSPSYYCNILTYFTCGKHSKFSTNVKLIQKTIVRIVYLDKPEISFLTFVFDTYLNEKFFIALNESTIEATVSIRCQSKEFNNYLGESRDSLLQKRTRCIMFADPCSAIMPGCSWTLSSHLEAFKCTANYLSRCILLPSLISIHCSE